MYDRSQWSVHHLRWWWWTSRPVKAAQKSSVEKYFCFSQESKLCNSHRSTWLLLIFVTDATNLHFPSHTISNSVSSTELELLLYIHLLLFPKPSMILVEQRLEQKTKQPWDNNTSSYLNLKLFQH